MVATFAVTPLLWPHYFVLALVPLLRFVRWRGRWDAAGAWALFAYVLMSRPLVEFMYEHARAGLFTR